MSIHNRNLRTLTPKKYYSGLTQKQKQTRKKEIARFSKMNWTDSNAYAGFKTNVLGSIKIKTKTKTSQYTRAWRKRFPNDFSLVQKANATGVPVRFLRESFNRGMAAWRTGHRPGASQHSWAFARVHSLLLCGKTRYGADADIVRRASRASRKAKRWFSHC